MAESAIVTVRGEASVEVPPNLATVMHTVHAAGPSAERVRTDLAEASEQVRRVGDRWARSLETLASVGLHVAPVFKTADKITGYTGTLTTRLVVVNFDELPALLSAFGAVPRSEVSGPWWSLHRDHPAHRQVRLNAVAAAVRRAQDYAAAFHTTLGDLVEVSDLDPAGPGPMRAFAIAKGQPEAELVLAPEQQTVQAQVTVRFTLRDASVTPRS